MTNKLFVVLLAEDNEHDIKYCYYCKAVIHSYDKFEKTEKGLIHNNDVDDCGVKSKTFIDEFGDVVNDE